MSPLIAVTSSLRSANPLDPNLCGCPQTYIEAVAACDGVPFILPLLDDCQPALIAARQAQGILLTGGEDVAPELYGQSRHPQLGPVCEGRDRSEIALVHFALKQKIPLLAICRGIQVLNVALGGDLYQDLKAQHNPESIHSGGANRPWKELRHSIRISPDSRLFRILGVESLLVNSLHHQAVRRVAPGLIAVAWADDGIIEGLEAQEGFVLGVQCHPEAVFAAEAPLWKNLFRSFVAAAAQCLSTASRSA